MSLLEATGVVTASFRDERGIMIYINAVQVYPFTEGANSDGDLQMLQWTTSGSGPRFALIVRYTDNAGREWAYDRTSQIGKLDKALDEAEAAGQWSA